DWLGDPGRDALDEPGLAPGALHATRTMRAASPATAFAREKRTDITSIVGNAAVELKVPTGSAGAVACHNFAIWPWWHHPLAAPRTRLRWPARGVAGCRWVTVQLPAVIDTFHPAVRTWFGKRFPEGPTLPQAGGWAEIAAGRDTLIAAPTGSGKTLAAFLVC